MLFWMARTDSLLVLSEDGYNNLNAKYALQLQYKSRCVLTFDQVVVGFSPGVAVLGCQDANRFLVSLQRGVPDLLQLHVNLVYCQWGAIAVVHI